jgi:hypothetical protein
MAATMSRERFVMTVVSLSPWKAQMGILVWFPLFGHRLVVELDWPGTWPGRHVGSGTQEFSSCRSSVFRDLHAEQGKVISPILGIGILFGRITFMATNHPMNS